MFSLVWTVPGEFSKVQCLILCSQNGGSTILSFFFLISSLPSMQWKQIKFGHAGWPRELAEDKASVWRGFPVATQHWGGRRQQGTQRGHWEGCVQPKGWPWNDAGLVPAGMSPQAGMSHWALLLEPEYTCICASQRVRFHSFQLGLRKCSVNCTFKIALGWCLR